jgi:hypothetical protein
VTILSSPSSKEVLPIAIHREGSFRMEEPPTETRCGPATIPAHEIDFRYEACIHTSEEHLDENGWIVDGTTIHHYFTKTLSRSEFVSCERLTLQAVKDLRQLAPGCRRVEVKLTNGTNSVKFASHWPTTT